MDGLKLASAGDYLKLWDCDNGFSLIHTSKHHCNNIGSLSWSSDGNFLASCSMEDEKVILTYISALRTTIELPCGAGIQCTDFSSDSRLLLCGGTEGVSIWDLKTKTKKKSFQKHKGPVTTACYNWNGSYIASGSETGEIILHNTVTGQSSSPMVAPNVQAIKQLEYSASMKSMFGTASEDGAVTLWDANTRRMIHCFKDAHVGPATGIAFSPINGMLMMSVGLDKRFVCYDIQKKQILKVIDAPSPLTCIDIMSDGATAAVGSTRGKIFVYNLRQGGSTPIHVFQAHKTSVHSVKFMPVTKAKIEDSGEMKSSVPSSGCRRQLPSAPAPTVMQDITPSKTGQTPDTETGSRAVSPPQMTDIFSPAANQGNQSHNKSAAHFNLTASHGEDSFAGVFSPLTKGAAELSAVSQTGNRDSSLFSVPSFLKEENSIKQSPRGQHTTSLSNVSNNNAVSAARGQESKVHFNDSLHSLASDSLPGHQHHVNLTAGHLSHLQHSGTVHSPLLGNLSHPQMSSSLQNSAAEPPNSVAASSHQQSTEIAQNSQQMVQGSHASHQSAVNAVSDFLPSDPLKRSRMSASPDSAAISGEEYGEADISPRGNSSQTSVPGSSHVRLPLSNGCSTAAGPVDLASSDAGVMQREFLKSLVADAMEELQDDLHRDMQGLHVSMLRQFHNLEKEMRSTLTHYSETNQKLMLYIRQLEEENRRLKKNY